MGRKQTIGYLILFGILTVGLLILLAMCHILLFLLGLIIVVVVVGLLREKTDLFDSLKKQERSIYPLQKNRNEVRPKPKRFSPHLILVSHNVPSIHQVLIDRPVFTIGRDPKCNCSITEIPELSRVHATIQYDESTGISYISDHKSQNGTYVNGVKVKSGKRKQISNGDQIQLARAVFTAQIAHY